MDVIQWPLSTDYQHVLLVGVLSGWALPCPKADALPVTETVRKDVRKGVSHLRYTFHSLSDGGTHFPEQMKKTSQTLGSYHRRYHPQSSGTAERTNGKTGLKQNKFLSRRTE